jgi:hypothetical protein
LLTHVLNTGQDHEIMTANWSSDCVAHFKYLGRTVAYCHDLVVAQLIWCGFGLETGFASITPTTNYNYLKSLLQHALQLHLHWCLKVYSSGTIWLTPEVFNLLSYWTVSVTNYLTPEVLNLYGLLNRGSLKLEFLSGQLANSSCTLN